MYIPIKPPDNTYRRSYDAVKGAKLVIISYY
jgi:hypothetical protein